MNWANGMMDEIHRELNALVQRIGISTRTVGLSPSQGVGAVASLPRSRWMDRLEMLHAAIAEVEEQFPRAGPGHGEENEGE